MKSHLNLSFVLIFSLLYLSGCAQGADNAAEQIGAAIMAIPEDLRDGAKVLGYDQKGELVTLREGTNNMICLADDPNKAGFNVACYHVDLEAFMARGRALKKEGKNANEVFDIREAEAKAGVLKMPENPSTLHILSGTEGKYDLATNTVTGANYRSVVYIAFATAESTGLPLQPQVPGGPWIMDPGTHRAHIMITPPPQN
ncbi:MAG: hypothetical protein KTR30_21175 [Saprospiraceae bacterium]|nr:hypothetical protein [Saprospiraceae bacterium]